MTRDELEAIRGRSQGDYLNTRKDFDVRALLAYVDQLEALLREAEAALEMERKRIAPQVVGFCTCKNCGAFRDYMQEKTCLTCGSALAWLYNP